VEGTAEDWACVARESFPAVGRNEYGHLRLADFTDTVNALPQEEMQAVMGPAGGPAAAAGVSGGRAVLMFLGKGLHCSTGCQPLRLVSVLLIGLGVCGP
jgi:hypothetical protein